MKLLDRWSLASFLKVVIEVSGRSRTDRKEFP